MPESYLYLVHIQVIQDVGLIGIWAADATGFSESRYKRWFDVRADTIKQKNGWIKLHSIIDVKTSGTHPVLDKQI